jgi:hypothetical protein
MRTSEAIFALISSILCDAEFRTSAHPARGIARKAKSFFISFSEKPSAWACLMNINRRALSAE